MLQSNTWGGRTLKLAHLRARAIALLVGLGLLAAACTGANRPQEGELLASEPTPGVQATAAPQGSAGPKVTTGGAPRSNAILTPPPAGAPLPKPPPVKETGPRLYSGAEDTLGITDDKVVFCAHAALTYGAAFNTSDADLNVYWEELNSKGGVWGRKVEITYENDNYSGPDAIAAAERCKAKKPAFIIGGIGFDQIPSVRDWAEKNRYLYVHHTATIEGTAGKKYSFSALPTVEKAGEMFAELALSKYKNKKIGVIGRDSVNWMPGIKAFDKLADGRLDIVKRIFTPKDHHNYSLEISEMRRAGVEVLWFWENALAATEMIQQAKGQGWSPTFMVFPFNLTSQTLGDQALDPKMAGVAVWNAYSWHDYSGPFAAYASDIKEFERQYAKWRPNADIRGVGGDLLFLNWQGMKSLHALLQACGPDCTRNRMADVIRGSKYPRSGAVCGVDFLRPGRQNYGGYQVSTMETYRSPSGQVNWRNTATCKEHLI
jgi:ABC-type branched-subunit amino acid transport system substrate-binding protein